VKVDNRQDAENAKRDNPKDAEHSIDRETLATLASWRFDWEIQLKSLILVRHSFLPGSFGCRPQIRPLTSLLSPELRESKTRGKDEGGGMKDET